jgi:hypothetical protein
MQDMKVKLEIEKMVFKINIAIEIFSFHLLKTNEDIILKASSGEEKLQWLAILDTCCTLEGSFVSSRDAIGR